MSDYSQRKAWNNDGMDPDWRPSTPEAKPTQPIIADIFNWAWKCGLDVTLTSIQMDVPLRYSVRFARDSVDQFSPDERMKAEFPRLIFSRGDKQIEVVATNWKEMSERLIHTHAKIFSDLNCPTIGAHK